MTITILRHLADSSGTYGKLFIDNKFICFTLEPSNFDISATNKGCISEGDYEFKITHSMRLLYFSPQLFNVPNFTGIRIHIGNSKKDTSGCILVGQFLIGSRIFYSKKAFTELMKLLPPVGNISENFIQIINTFKA